MSKFRPGLETLDRRDLPDATPNQYVVVFPNQDGQQIVATVSPAPDGSEQMVLTTDEQDGQPLVVPLSDDDMQTLLDAGIAIASLGEQPVGLSPAGPPAVTATTDTGPLDLSTMETQYNLTLALLATKAATIQGEIDTIMGLQGQLQVLQVQLLDVWNSPNPSTTDIVSLIAQMTAINIRISDLDNQVSQDVADYSATYDVAVNEWTALYAIESEDWQTANSGGPPPLFAMLSSDAQTYLDDLYGPTV